MSLGKIDPSNNLREERYVRPDVRQLSFADGYRVKVMDRTTAQCDIWPVVNPGPARPCQVVPD
jgi:hypothetical protein